MFSRLAVVDVETTGLSPAMGHRVCEIGVVLVENGRVTEKFETLVNPRRRIDGMATLVHGLEDSDVRTAPPISRVMPRLLRMLDGAVFVAHSAAFDHSFLEHEIRREHGRSYGFPSNVVCTKRFAWRKFGYGNGRLDYVCRRLRVKNRCPHHALPDAEAEVEVLRRLAGSLRPSALETAVTKAGLLSWMGRGRFPMTVGRAARAFIRNH